MKHLLFIASCLLTFGCYKVPRVVCEPVEEYRQARLNCSHAYDPRRCAIIVFEVYCRTEIVK